MASEQTKRNTTIDINALTAAAVAELHKQQNTPNTSNPVNASSSIQQQLQQFTQQQQRQGQGQSPGGAAKDVPSSAPPQTLNIQQQQQEESPEVAETHMPARHGWEVDWLSSELVKAREEIAKVLEENAQLRLKLEAHSKFVVHSSRPVVSSTQSMMDGLQTQQALDALLKNHHHHQQQSLQQIALRQALGMQSGQIQNAMPAPQQQQQIDQSMLLPQTINQLAGLVSKPPPISMSMKTHSNINAATALPVAQVTKALQQHDNPSPSSLQQQVMTGGATTAAGSQAPQNAAMDLTNLLRDQAASASSAMDIAKVEKLLLAVQNATKNGTNG
jgi:hypothetical protein